MSDPYTINLDGGKYTITNWPGSLLEFRRHGEDWPGADDLKYAKVVRAMAERIQALEETIKVVLDGSLDPLGGRRHNGMEAYAGYQMISAWRHDLRKVLEQK